MPGEWLTTAEAAELAGVSPRTIDDWCYRRVVRFYKPGRERRFRRSEFVAFLERYLVEVAS